MVAAFHAPLTPAITLPSSAPARKSVSTAFINPGFVAIASIDWAISTPFMAVSVAFQLQWFVTLSSFTPKSRPVLPKNAYIYQPELQSMVIFLPFAAATASMPSRVCTSSSVK